METIKVSKLANIGQFERYAIHNLPKFLSVNEFKKYLLANYSGELSPASNWSSLTIGHMSEGRRKCDIKTDKQLEDACQSIKNGWITLLVDPHSVVKSKQDEKEKKGKSSKKEKNFRYDLITNLLAWSLTFQKCTSNKIANLVFIVNNDFFPKVYNAGHPIDGGDSRRRTIKTPTKKD